MIDSNARRAALFTIVALALLSCGDETASTRFGAGPTPGGVTSRNLVDAGYSGRFRVATTVLESPDHGPQLCDAVAESYPPQCSGPDIVGWDWQDVDGEQSESGTTWGSWLVVGTWDGERFTLTERPREDDGAARRAADVDFTSPCAEPDGGWQPVDQGKATSEALGAAFARAAASEEYAGGWIDQPYLDDVGVSPPVEDVANDPARLVLNLRFTGHLDRHQREVREVWGGALCISAARHTEAELNAIQEQLHREFPSLQSSSEDVVLNAVVVSTWLATRRMQTELDARYGDGTIILYGLLEPID